MHANTAVIIQGELDLSVCFPWTVELEELACTWAWHSTWAVLYLLWVTSHIQQTHQLPSRTLSKPTVTQAVRWKASEGTVLFNRALKKKSQLLSGTPPGLLLSAFRIQILSLLCLPPPLLLQDPHDKYFHLLLGHDPCSLRSCDTGETAESPDLI